MIIKDDVLTTSLPFSITNTFVKLLTSRDLFTVKYNILILDVIFEMIET